MTEAASTTKQHQSLLRRLERTYGHVMASRQIRELLAFPSAAAFRQAMHRGAVNIRMFNMPSRRGLFAMTEDVAKWLAEHSEVVVQPAEDGKPPRGGSI